MPHTEPRLVLIMALAGLIPACVIGRTSRPTGAESAQGPLAPPVVGAPVVPATLAESSDVPPDKAQPGAVWVEGYWHWDGVKYVWQRGRWRQADRN